MQNKNNIKKDNKQHTQQRTKAQYVLTRDLHHISCARLY